MKSLTIIFCLLIVNFGTAESLEWHSGVIVLKSNEVLKGNLSINQIYDLVLFQDGEKVTVYPAHKIQGVRYFDEKANINRKFISIREKENASTVHRVFEIVLAGDISVIRKLSSSISNPQDDASGYNYYLRSGEEIIPMRKFKSKLYHKLVNSSEALVDFIDANKLNADFSSDVIKIIEFHNTKQAANIIVRRY